MRTRIHCRRPRLRSRGPLDRAVMGGGDSVVGWAAAVGLDPGPVPFRRDHSHLLRPALLALLTEVSLGFMLCGVGRRARASFQFRAEFNPGDLAVRSLRALALAAHLDPGRPVPQPDGGRGLVDLLPSRTRATHELLIDVARPHAERRQPCKQGFGNHARTLDPAHSFSKHQHAPRHRGVPGPQSETRPLRESLGLPPRPPVKPPLLRSLRYLL